MIGKINVSAVSFVNTYPFIYGLTRSALIKQMNLSLDIPSDCALKLENGEADIGLVPVAAIPNIKNAEIISSYCIGAEKRIRTVQLLSNQKIEDLSVVYLDSESRTSNLLVQILSKFFWKKEIHFVRKSLISSFRLKKGEGRVAIGDKAFELENAFSFNYDLAYEWNQFTGLPFVFACWVATIKPDAHFLNVFNVALKEGVDNIKILIDENFNNVNRIDKINVYFSENVSYDLDNQKKEAMKLFFNYIDKIKSELI